MTTPNDIRERTLKALQRSALANNGTPCWADVHRTLNIPTTTLRRWWRKAYPELDERTRRGVTLASLPNAPAAVSPSSPSSPATPRPRSNYLARARQLLDLNQEELAAELVAEFLQERDTCRDLGAATVAGRLTSDLPKLLADLRPMPSELDFDESLLPREEFERRLLMAAEGLGERDFELLLGAYADRHNGRLLFEGVGGHRAALVDSAWVIEVGE